MKLLSLITLENIIINVFPFACSFLRECLSIWARSPQAYKQLRGSGLLLLPSTRTLTLYKNSNEQGPGIQEFMLDWMVKEAERLSVPPHGYCGGLMFDEMSLQVFFFNFPNYN